MKKKPGENFEGLDLLTKLLTPNCAPQRLATNLIEEVNGLNINLFYISQILIVLIAFL